MCKKISLHTTMTITRSHLSTYFFISHYYAQWDAIIMHKETMMYRSLSPELFRSPRSKTWVHLTGSLSGAGWGVGPSWGSLSRPCRAQLDRCSFLAQVESYITMLMFIYNVPSYRKYYKSNEMTDTCMRVLKYHKNQYTKIVGSLHHN